MEKCLDEELRGLVINLVGQEAIRIKCNRKSIERYKKKGNESKSTDLPDKTKREIYELFNGDYDGGIVRKDMLEYLNELVGFVDESVNPSFQMLKDMIEKGKYDFDFSRFVEAESSGG